ncbi:MAG TPA: protease modulator HflK [Myxococcota bacterium]|nr:protease modulator HflK [Myxococcota bacterium]
MSIPKLLAALFGLLVVLWLGSGVFVVNPGHSGVVFRFGAVARSVEPGVQVRLAWPIERQEIVAVGEVRRVESEPVRMLTGDTNLVDLQLVAQYSVEDAETFLLSARDPDALVLAAVLSAATRVVSTVDVDSLLTTGRATLQRTVKAEAQVLMAPHGVRIDAVELAELSPPPAVVDAFNDVSSARGDKDTIALAAEGYASDLLPRTRGEHRRRVELARAEAAARGAEVEGDVARFDGLQPTWKEAPEAVEGRLRRETWEAVEAEIIVVEAGSSLVWRTSQ